MNKTKSSIFLLALATAFITQLSAPREAQAKEEHSGGMPMVEMLKDKSGDAFDKPYLQMMIQHHKSGVRMAKLAVEKGKQERIKDMGRKIIPAQNREIDQMSGWLSEWYKAEGSAGMEPKSSQEKMSKAMRMLEKAQGAEFDKMFLQQMMMHHQEAIEMSKMASEKAKHAKVKELASKIVKDQSREKEEMAAMLQ